MIQAQQRGLRHRLAGVSVAVSTLLSVVVLFAPEVPGPGLVDVPGFDKAVHVAVFALLTATSRWRFGRVRGLLAVLVAYAVLSEVVQATWLADRGGDPVDVLADLVGVAIAWCAADAWSRARPGTVPATSPTERGRTP